MFELMSENIEKNYTIRELKEKIKEQEKEARQKIYIAIDHINGEMQEVLPRLYKYKEAKELYINGYIIIEIDKDKNKVEEWK